MAFNCYLVGDCRSGLLQICIYDGLEMGAWIQRPGNPFFSSRTSLSPALTRIWSRSLSSSHSSIRDLLKHKAQGQATTVNGFVKSIRKQKRVAFAEITDGSTSVPLQAVLRPEQAEIITNGAAVNLHGSYIPSLEGKEQDSELRVSEVQCLGANDVDAFPIQKKYQTPEFLRTLPHLRVRTARNALLLRLRSHLIAKATQFFQEQGYTQTHPPIITSSDCEGAGEVFEVNEKANSSRNPNADGPLRRSFFGAPKYLTVSSQLHLEALAHSVGRVWALSPTFRAEKSDTPRHLSEFYMLEAELCFTEGLEDIMHLLEALIKTCIRDLEASQIGQELQKHRPYPEAEGELDQSPSALTERWNNLRRSQWPRVTYHAAINYLQEAVNSGRVQFNTTVDPGAGLQTEHERYLAEAIGKSGPVFVTDYPKRIKPFYMAPSTDVVQGDASEPTVACFDLLLPDVCETAGGSLREHRLEPLQLAMEEQGLLGKRHDEASKRQDMDWYLDLRRFGGVPHGGFGLGFDRLVGYLAGVRNIRDIVAFPRWYGRCDC